MSGEYVEKLKKRAENFMKEAEEASDKDLAIFFIEQSLQIYVKAVYYELFGEKIRGHSLRTILGTFARSLEKQEFKEASEKNKLIRKHPYGRFNITGRGTQKVNMENYHTQRKM